MFIYICIRVRLLFYILLYIFGRKTQVRRLNLTVEILVNAAGVCRLGRVENCADGDLTAQLLLNVVGTSRLTRLFAKGNILKHREMLHTNTRQHARTHTYIHLDSTHASLHFFSAVWHVVCFVTTALDFAYEVTILRGCGLFTGCSSSSKTTVSTYHGCNNSRSASGGAFVINPSPTLRVFFFAKWFLRGAAGSILSTSCNVLPVNYLLRCLTSRASRENEVLSHPLRRSVAELSVS